MSSQYPVPKWIEQLHAGKEEAYRILFDEYYQMLCVFAMKYIKDKEVAEDIVQDIILELYSRRLRFNTPVALKSFLFLSVKNRALNFLAPSAGTRTLSEYFGGRRKFFPEQYHPRRGILSSAKNDRGTLRPCAENLRTDFTGILQ